MREAMVEVSCSCWRESWSTRTESSCKASEDEELVDEIDEEEAIAAKTEAP